MIFSLQSGGYQVTFSLFELFLSILGMVIFAFLGSYWGVLAGNIKRDKDIETIKDRITRNESNIALGETSRKELARELRQEIADVDEGLTESVREVNNRIDRWIENPRFRGNT